MAARPVGEDLEALGLVVADVGDEPLAPSSQNGIGIGLGLAAEELAHGELLRVLPEAELPQLLVGEGDAAGVDGHVVGAQRDSW